MILDIAELSCRMFLPTIENNYKSAYHCIIFSEAKDTVNSLTMQLEQNNDRIKLSLEAISKFEIYSQSLLIGQ